MKNSQKKKKFLTIILIVVVVLLLIIFLIIKYQKAKQLTPEEQQIEALKELNSTTYVPFTEEQKTDILNNLSKDTKGTTATDEEKLQINNLFNNPPTR